MKTDIQRAFTSWGFIVALFGTSAVLFFGSLESLLPIMQQAMGEGPVAGFHEQVLLTALQSGIVLLAMPVLAALPYTAAFVDDCKSGILKEYLPRCGKKRYIRAKVLASGLSGAAALFAGIFITYFIYALVFTPMEILPQAPDQAANIAMMSSAQTQMPSMFPQILEGAFLFFLAGFFWSLVGGLFGALTMKWYLAYALPFVLYYGLANFFTWFFSGTTILNPQNWINPAAEWPGGMWGTALFLAELIVIAAVLYAVAVKKRLVKV